jgi:hypothetical protein
MAITIWEVCRRMGLEPDANLTLRTAFAAKERYKKQFGVEPEVVRRAKNKGGSAFLAVYPDDWEPIIQEIIKEIPVEKRSSFGVLKDVLDARGVVERTVSGKVGECVITYKFKDGSYAWRFASKSELHDGQ